VVQPTTLVLALALLLGTATRAQPGPAREQRQRSLTVTGDPADPPREIRVARGVFTVLSFKSQLRRDAIEAEGRGTRIQVDAGDTFVILEPLIDLGATERLMLSVPFDDGQRAVFVLVPHGSEVDTRIDVVRREQTVQSCQAELAEAQARCAKISPTRFVSAGWLTLDGVVAQALLKCGVGHPAAGVECQSGTSYRAQNWALVAVQIHNTSNEHPWRPREVSLKGMRSGVRLTVRAVEMEPARLAPGARGRVFVELDPPHAAEPFVLELGDGGHTLKIPEVNFSARKEDKP
jgi:uncharacterized protein (TIGR02268 family)